MEETHKHYHHSFSEGNGSIDRLTTSFSNLWNVIEIFSKDIISLVSAEIGKEMIEKLKIMYQNIKNGSFNEFVKLIHDDEYEHNLILRIEVSKTNHASYYVISEKMRVRKARKDLPKFEEKDEKKNDEKKNDEKEDEKGR